MDATNQEWEVDVSGLFAACGISMKGTARFNAHTYEIDAKEPKNNWLYPAYFGFLELQKKLADGGKSVRTFVSVGTGSGLDGVLGYEAFHPRSIVLTDNHPDVIDLARDNCEHFVPPSVRVSALAGNLCQPLCANDAIAEVIYANLPNIPDNDEEVLIGMRSATFVANSVTAGVPDEYRRYLLGTQYAFLQDAKHSLVDGGSVVVNLGGRIPVALVQKMFKECGYDYEELFTMFKAQSQPEEVLGGYCGYERHGVSFDFYRYGAARTIADVHPDIPAEALKSLLAPHHLSATEALEELGKGVAIGHIVQVIRGKKL